MSYAWGNRRRTDVFVCLFAFAFMLLVSLSAWFAGFVFSVFLSFFLFFYFCLFVFNGYLIRSAEAKATKCTHGTYSNNYRPRNLLRLDKRQVCLA